MEQKTILLLGLPGSGKSSLAKLLYSHGWSSVSAGNIIRELARNAGSGETREELQNFGKDYLEKHGEQHFAAILAEKAAKNRCSVIEGVRPIITIKHLINIIEGMVVVYIECKSHIRHHRLSERDSISLLEFQRLENHEMEVQVLAARPLANLVLDNNGPLKATFDTLFRELKRRCIIK